MKATNIAGDALALIRLRTDSSSFRLAGWETQAYTRQDFFSEVRFRYDRMGCKPATALSAVGAEVEAVNDGDFAVDVLALQRLAQISSMRFERMISIVATSAD